MRSGTAALSPISPITARDLVEKERNRQRALGFTAAHDAQHQEGQLAAAALCYGMAYDPATLDPSGDYADGNWPFDVAFRPKLDRVQNLICAAALLEAEIDRYMLAAGAPTNITD